MKDVVTNSKDILSKEIEFYNEDITVINDALAWIELRLGASASHLMPGR